MKSLSIQSNFVFKHCGPFFFTWDFHRYHRQITKGSGPPQQGGGGDLLHHAGWHPANPQDGSRLPQQDSLLQATLPEAAQVGPGPPACLMTNRMGDPRRSPVLGVDIQAGVTCPRKAGPTWPARCWVPSTCLRDRVSRMEVPGLCESMGRPHTWRVSNRGARRGGLGCAWEGLLQIRWLYLFSGTSVLCTVLRSQTAEARCPRGVAWGRPRQQPSGWAAPAGCSVLSVHVQTWACHGTGVLWQDSGLRPVCWEGSDPRSMRALLAPQHLGGAFLLGGTLASGQLR